MFNNKKPFKNKKNALYELRHLYNNYSTDAVLGGGLPITTPLSGKNTTIENDGGENTNTVDFLRLLCFMGYMKKNGSSYQFTEKGIDYCASYNCTVLDWMNQNPWAPGLIAGGISLAITVTKLINSPVA